MLVTGGEGEVPGPDPAVRDLLDEFPVDFSLHGVPGG